MLKNIYRDLAMYTNGILILRKRVTVTNLLVDVYFTFYTNGIFILRLRRFAYL